MTNDVSTEQAVATLLGERQRYEAWLGALEAKRANTPQHIYQRVHADYSARLQRVVEQLVSHRTAIQEMANDLVDRLTSLDIDESKHRDERSEAEVRAAVGEITTDDCTEILSRTDAELERINGERTTITTELTRLRSLLDAGMQPARSSGTTATTAMPSPPAGASFDELEFLNSVIEQRGNGAAAPVAPMPAAPDLGVPAIEHGSGNPLDLPATGSVSQQQDIGLKVEPSVPEPSLNGHMPVAPPVEEPRSLGSESRARETRDSVPSFLKDMPPEQVKTLKCQECGTLNYPTEWYCERCGAELAAL
jgi:hypothetical protein